MKILAFLLLGLTILLAPLAAAAQTAPAWRICRNPVRVFGRANIDLMPLFDWWNRQPKAPSTNADEVANAEAQRPLNAWARVTGIKVAEVGESWLVNAVIYHSPTVRTNARIILNHPPVVEEQAYYQLRARLEQNARQIAAARGVYQSNTNAEMRALALADIYRRSVSKVAVDGVRVYSVVALRKHAAAAAALTTLDQLEADRREIENQMKPIPSADGVYRIDWFAVELGRTKQGMPIYDLGLVSATPP